MSSVAQQAPFSLLFYSDWRFQKKYIKKKQKIHFCKVFRENEIISYPKYIRERKEEKKTMFSLMMSFYTLRVTLRPLSVRQIINSFGRHLRDSLELRA